MTMKQPQSPFRFRKNDSIGEAEAELDRLFLINCFEDTGDLEPLMATDRPQAIVLGRTGSGKSAALIRIADGEMSSTDTVAWIRLDELTLHYLSGCTILKYLESLNVSLDKFFKLLWKHIIVIELIKMKYPINNEAEKKNFIEKMLNIFSHDKRKEKAIKYLEEWSGSFFETTEHRIRELTNTLEDKVQASLKALAPGLEARVGIEDGISIEQKTEVVARVQKVVNEIQIVQLNEVLKMLAEEVFPTPQPPYYVLIDKLDENWVDDTVKYRLIRDLLQVVKEDFSKIPGVKVVVALRQDLIDRVFQFTKDPGTQREKFGSLFQNLKWNQEQLLNVLDKRVDQLVRRKYTNITVSWRDLLPSHVDGGDTGTWLVERTLYRPRDIITFFNMCIERSDNEPKITLGVLKAAESAYSKARLHALYDEWDIDYPDLPGFVNLLSSRPTVFRFGAYEPSDVESYCLSYSVDEPDRTGELSKYALLVAEGELEPAHFLRRVMSVFYRVGIIGLKISKTESTNWSFLGGAEIKHKDISEDASISICPAFYRVLSIKVSKKN